jgi:hypothetical protein
MPEIAERPDTGLSPERAASLRKLSDAELLARVRRLAARERRATALLVAHLAELAARDLHLAAGYSSLFVFCRDALSLAEHDAYNRVEVARATRRFPALVDRLAAGGLNLNAARLLAPHLTTENHLALLEAARGKKKAEIEEMVASLAPYPEAPTFVRRLPAGRREFWAPVRAPAPMPAATASPSPAPASSNPPAPAGTPAAGPDADAPAGDPPVVFASWRPAGSASDLTPLAPDRYRLQLTISRATLEKLRLAKDMLRHAIPSGDEAAILDRALTVLLADLARAKFAATDNPRAARGTAPGSRHIPAEVRRAVWLRDLGRCAFVADDGRRCDERAFVEFHHLRPYAADGEATVENIQLRCRRHNAYESRTFFVHRQA